MNADEIITDPHSLKEVRTKILSGSKFSVVSRIYFQSVSKMPINQDMAKDHQKRMGYDFAGYDFEGFKNEYDKASDGFVATWYCYGSCD